MTFTESRPAIDNNIAQTKATFKYQVNSNLSIAQAKKVLTTLQTANKTATVKTALQVITERYNKLTFWKTETGTVQSLFEHCRNGETTRGGIKIGGNSKENVTEVNFIFVDIDNETFVLDSEGNRVKNERNKFVKKLLDKPVTWQDTTATKYGMFACFWYPSPSYTEENQKHRLGFRLDRTVDILEAEALLKYLYDTLNADNPDIVADESCFDAGRLYYGASNSTLGQIIDEDITLPVDQMLREARELNEKKYFNPLSGKIENRLNVSKSQIANGDLKSEKNTTSESREKLSITDKVLQYLHDEIFVKKLNSDVESLYCLYGHNFKQIKPDQEQMIDKYEGYNPFSASDKSGSSFVVCCWDNQLPSFVDRSKSFSRYKDVNGRYQHGGTFIDYFVFVAQQTFGKYKEITGKKDIVGKVFKQIVKDICEYFSVEPFDFKQSSENQEIEIAISFMEAMNDKIFRFTGNGQITTFFCFSEKHKRWIDITNKHTFVAEILIPWMKAEYGADDKNIYSLKLLKFIWDYVCYQFPDSFDTYLDKKENLNYLPMQNGLYDIANHRLIENDGSTLNRNVSKYFYSRVTEENENVKIFLKWLNVWLKDERKVDLILNWFSLVCQRQAYQTGNMLGFIGDPGCGKSTATEFLYLLTMGFNKKPSIGVLSNVNNTHGTTILENTQALIFEEFTVKSGQHSLEIFKDITGKSGKDKNFETSINPKGEKQRMIDARMSITFDCQDIPRGLNDLGFERRTVYMFVDQTNKSNEAKELNEKILSHESVQDIFNWLISRDVEKSLEKFNELKELDIVKENTVKVRQEEPLPQFIIERLEITNDETDVSTSHMLYAEFEKYIVESGDYKMSRTKFSKELKKILESKSYGFNWKGFKKDVRQGKVVVNGFTGLKIRTSFDSFENAS